jgi:hypothetical protein
MSNWQLCVRNGLHRLDTSVNACNTPPEVPPRSTTTFVQTTADKASFLNHPCKVLLTWEAANGFNQILVRVAITSKD